MLGKKIVRFEYHWCKQITDIWWLEFNKKGCITKKMLGLNQKVKPQKHINIQLNPLDLQISTLIRIN